VSKRLYASNLPLSATEKTLAIKFSKFGIVLSVTLARDAATGISLRAAFIEMETAAGAQKAIYALNLAELDGRLISVYPAIMPVTH
jgi:RNA recognition motif-containing protein